MAHFPFQKRSAILFKVGGKVNRKKQGETGGRKASVEMERLPEYLRLT
jgi:hypothetical protein